MNYKKRLNGMITNNSRLLSFALAAYNNLPFNNTFRLHQNSLIIDTAILNKCSFRIKGNNNTIIIKKGCRLKKCSFYICGDNNFIELSEYVSGNNAEFYIEDNGNRIICKNNTTFAGRIHLACTEGKTIMIGNGCLFSSEIVLRTGDSHSVINDKGERINAAKDIEIGNHVWVGYRTLINKGVQVPDNCIIGTGSVLTHSFSQKGICIAGNPAGIIKENISWLTERV